jgi:acyl carrier protein
VNHPETIDRVAAIVAAACGPGVALEPDTEFLQAGYIDSFAIIEMVGALEAEFGVAIAPEALTQENFATIASIAALIARGGG